MLKPVLDTAQAQWLVDLLKKEKLMGVAGVVPAVYARYARIFHPGWSFDGHRRVSVRWAEMAARSGRRDHSLMQWHTIAAAPASETGVDDPDVGTLPDVVSAPLSTVLSQHTDSEACWIGVWCGYGWDYGQSVPVTKSINTGWRQWDLFRAPLSRMDWTFFEGVDQTANMIWPADRSWFLATEIDLNTSYVGGNAPLIEALIASEHLEVWPVEEDDDISMHSDILNSERSCP